MPQAILPLLAVIISGVGAATSLGMGIYNAENQPGAPKPPAPPTAAQNVSTEQQQRLQEAQQIHARLGGNVDMTSGMANPDYLAQISGTEAGYPGSPVANQVVNSWMGMPNPTTTAGMGGGSSSGLTLPGSAGGGSTTGMPLSIPGLTGNTGSLTPNGGVGSPGSGDNFDFMSMYTGQPLQNNMAMGGG